MARQKEFNPDRALNKALEIFWCQGYEATSMQDLVDGMGLSRSSLYDTFGDKHALYLAALERYRQREAAAMANALENAPTVKEGFRRIFDGIVAQSLADEQQQGCFMTNSMVELAPRDPEVSALAADNLAHVLTAFQAAIEKGQAKGELNEERDAAALAHYLFNAILGLRVMAKNTRDPQILRNVADVTVAALD